MSDITFCRDESMCVWSSSWCLVNNHVVLGVSCNDFLLRTVFKICSMAISSGAHLMLLAGYPFSKNECHRGCIHSTIILSSSFNRRLLYGHVQLRCCADIPLAGEKRSVAIYSLGSNATTRSCL
jgi:hypothetical protein